MKTTKKTTKKRKVQKTIQAPVEIEETPLEYPVESEPPFPVEEKKTRSFPSFTWLAILFLLGLLAGLVIAYKGNPVLAIVNGRPLFRWEVGEILFRRYGQQTTEGMITEQLVKDEANKANVAVSQADVQAREEEILKSFGSNLTVEDFLKFQGLERSDFDNQIKLQLLVQKLLEKDIMVSDQEVTSYIASNSAMLSATEPASLREEARKALVDEKLSTRLQTWLEEVRNKAAIQRFFGSQ